MTFFLYASSRFWFFTSSRCRCDEDILENAKVASATPFRKFRFSCSFSRHEALKFRGSQLRTVAAHFSNGIFPFVWLVQNCLILSSECPIRRYPSRFESFTDSGRRSIRYLVRKSLTFMVKKIRTEYLRNVFLANSCKFHFISKSTDRISVPVFHRGRELPFGSTLNGFFVFGSAIHPPSTVIFAFGA